MPKPRLGLTAGTRLGPYEIVAPLGAGGMGEVYRAHDERLRRDVAIKVVTAARADDPDHVRRLEQEGQTLGSLNHPNILAVYDIGTRDGALYVVSELLEGKRCASTSPPDRFRCRRRSTSPCRSASVSRPRTRRGSCTAISSRRTSSSRATVV